MKEVAFTSSAARGTSRGSVSCQSGCGTTYSEVLVGRVFVSLGVKFAEMVKSERKFRARAVYQGNNIFSRSGRSVYEIFHEVSNPPSSLTESFLHGRHKCLLAGLDLCRPWCGKPR